MGRLGSKYSYCLGLLVIGIRYTFRGKGFSRSPRVEPSEKTFAMKLRRSRLCFVSLCVALNPKRLNKKRTLNPMSPKPGRPKPSRFSCEGAGSWGSGLRFRDLGLSDPQCVDGRRRKVWTVKTLSFTFLYWEFPKTRGKSTLFWGHPNKDPPI